MGYLCSDSGAGGLSGSGTERRTMEGNASGAQSMTAGVKRWGKKNRKSCVLFMRRNPQKVGQGT